MLLNSGVFTLLDPEKTGKKITHAAFLLYQCFYIILTSQTWKDGFAKEVACLKVHHEQKG